MLRLRLLIPSRGDVAFLEVVVARKPLYHVYFNGVFRCSINLVPD